MSKTNETANVPVENKEMVSVDAPDMTTDITDFVGEFKTQKTNALICVSVQEGMNGTKALYKQINSPQQKLSDNIGVVIPMVGFIVHTVDVKDRKTNELTKAPRVIIADANGINYDCVSIGIYNEIAKLAAVFNFPTTEPVDIVVVEKEGKNGYDYLTIELA